MNIYSVDLNLLVFLHAVLETGSATLAARKLHVTQSAVSNALSRLRALFDDPLVVRHSHGLTPTPRALAMKPELDAVIGRLTGLLDDPPRFDPRTTTREFSLACADYYGVVLLPRLVSLLRERAPGATLRLLPLEHLSPPSGLSHDIDVHVGMPPSLPAGCLSTALFADRFVCLAPLGKRRARAPMSVREYTGALHVRVSVLGSRRDPIDAALAERGLARTIALTVPHFSVVPLVVAETGHVATLSRRLGEVYAKLLPLALRDPPIDLAEREVKMVWHRRTDADDGARFFRGVIAEAGR